MEETKVLGNCKALERREFVLEEIYGHHPSLEKGHEN
jgi:hypothetical protein